MGKGKLDDMDFGDNEQPCEFDDNGRCIHHEVAGRPLEESERDIIKATLENFEKVGAVLGSTGMVLRMGKMIMGRGPYAELEEILKTVVAPLVEAIRKTRAMLESSTTPASSDN